MCPGIMTATERTVVSRRFLQGTLITIFLIFLLTGPSSGALNGTETLVTTDTVSSPQMNPAISGSFITWEDYRPMNPNVYVYNIATGDEFPAAPDDYLMQTMPAISGSGLVWQQFDTNSFTYSLQVFDLTSHILTSVAANPGSDPQYTPEDNCFPKIFNDEVVWQDYNVADWDIYLYNITTSVTTPVATAAADQKHPAVYGHLIAYENRSDPAHPEIWLYNITDASSENIAPGSYGINPVLSQDYIVWQDVSGSVFRIFSYNINTGITHRVTPAFLTSQQTKPSLYDHRVVVEDYRRSANSDVYLYDLQTGAETWVSPQPTGSIQVTPAIYGDTLVWDDSRSGTSDIYLFTLGSSDICPVADFSPSINAGPDLSTVVFTDHSAGSPILFRIWNYSDGTTSYPLDPVGQVFSGAGVYHTRLTVGNTKCRNTTPAIAKYDIYINTPPAADFIAAPLAGFAPLAVQFTDTSGGDPATWTWDFGDGSVSHIQNPGHTYTTAGQAYTVSLTVNNTLAGMVTDTETKTGYIRTFLGATGTATTPIQGITVIPRYGGWFLLYNATMLPDMATPLPTVLTTFHPDSAGWQNITFVSPDAAGFSDTFGNNTFMGNLSQIVFQTEDVTASGISPAIGTGWGVNYRQVLSGYPTPASILTEIWESTTISDQSLFDRIIIGSNYITNPDGIAYTAHIIKSGFPSNGNATLNMSVSRSWIGGKEAQTSIIGYGVTSQGNTVGQVIPARFLFTDGTLDYFEADAPAYFTTFGISPLSGSGNPLQLITLTVTSHVPPPPQNNPPADTDSSMPGAGAGAGKVTFPVITPTPNSTPTPLPTEDPGKSAKVYTNANGVVTQATRLQSSDGRATVTIPVGIVAKDARGKPLSEITIRALPSESLPDVPAGSVFTFAGMAYEIGPDGATFSPPISVTFTSPQVQWGQDYTVKTFDKKSGSWQDLPTTFDATTGTITAQFSHLCTFALFSEPRAAPGTPGTPSSTPAPAPAAPQVKVQPPATAVSIFMSILGWVADLMVNNIIPFMAFIFLGIAGYLVVQGRFPGSGQ